jgi:hypothetical protein
MSNTATDWLSFGSGFSGVSTQRFFDFGWVFTNSEPPPWPFSTRPLPGVLLVLLRVGADQRDVLVAERAGDPDRPEFGWVKFAPRPGCGILSTSISAIGLALLRVDHRDLVRLVRRRHEVAVRRVPAAVMQEARGIERGDAERIDVAVVDQQDAARFP